MFEGIKEADVIRIYKKYKTMNRTALSCGCDPAKVKKILEKNNIERFKYKPVQFIGNLKNRHQSSRA